MCSELHYLHVLGPVRYLLIVSIGMGFVYVIVYFATYIHWRYMCTYMYIQYLIHVQPTSASAA